MKFLYNLGIVLYGIALKGLQPFHSKAKLFVEGRKSVFNDLAKFKNHKFDKVIWVHVASVGEFEQSRVLIEKIKTTYSNYGIILTFFSPSGFELRKNYHHADLITYLPLDSKKNAETFLELSKPDIAIFTKYEFWYHYFNELKSNDIPILSISSIFRKDQPYFKSKNGFYANILKKVDYFFVQNEESLSLLKEIGITNAQINGDTRVDRVNEISRSEIEIKEIPHFTSDKPVFVFGSVWKEDMEVILPLIDKYAGKIKFIIAPHEINHNEIEQYREIMSASSMRFSQFNKESAGWANVLWIDNIGMLSALYKYGHFAYVGGAFGSGLHNILEPATFGLPIFFGDRKYSKFQEAQDLIALEVAFSISNKKELLQQFELVFNDDQVLKTIKEKSNAYLHDHLGASERIFNFCQQNYFSES